jgi:predicted dehydrogenase
MPTRIAILGLEFWPHAKFIAEALRGSHEHTIIGASSADATLARWFQQAFDVPVVPYMDRLWDLKPDIAFISGKLSESHRDTIVALDHKCHVLGSRPIALTSAGGTAIIAAMRRNDGYLVTPQYHTRFYPEVRQMLRLIVNGDIGTPSWGSFVAQRPGAVQGWPDGPPGWWMDKAHNLGGGFAMWSVYCLNLARVIFGPPREDIEIKGAMFGAQSEMEERGAAIVQFGDAIVSFDGSWLAPPGTGGFAFTVVGDRGEVSVDYRRTPVMYQVVDGEKKEFSFPPLDRDKVWRDMLDNLVKAGAGECQLDVPAEQSVSDLELLERIYRESTVVQAIKSIRR